MDAVTAPAKDLNHFDYFTEIEETFVRLRGRQMIISPIDWALIDQWKDRGIPLHIVLRAIETVFRAYHQRSGNKQAVNSLAYCRPEVESQFAAWQTSQVGKSATSNDAPQTITRETAAAHIKNVIAALRAVEMPELQDGIIYTLGLLDALESSLPDDIEAIDSALVAVEDYLATAMLDGWPADDLDRLKKEIAAQLDGYGPSDEQDRQRTFDLMLLKQMRDIAGVPRLSLFFL